ncbi:gp36 [Listeria monocytogenes FSL F2-208]|nr:gp36 [Listeria monocytogenes FSL F2-208]
MAVIYFTGDDWVIVYDTPVTTDVLGDLNKDSLKQALEDIYNLPVK